MDSQLKDLQLEEPPSEFDDSSQTGGSSVYQKPDSKPMHTGGSNKLLLALLLLGSALILISLGYLLGTKPWKKTQGQPDLENNTRQTISDSTPASDWLTYQNVNPPYTISYPSDWTIDTSKAAMQPDSGASLVLKKDGYQLNISWPDGYSPGGCIFSDSPDFNNAPLPQFSLCPGEFVQFDGASEKIYRRLQIPELHEDAFTQKTSNAWVIYSKEADSSHFVGVPPISYQAPENYEQTVIATMDQIVASMSVQEDSITEHYFPEIGLTMQVPNDLYVFERYSSQPPRQDGEPFTLYVQNYNEENPAPTAEANFQMYFLLNNNQNTSPEEQLAFARTTLSPETMEELTVDGHPLLRGQVAGSRNRFYAGIITDSGLLEIFTSEPTPENERLAYEIISTFQFD